MFFRGGGTNQMQNSFSFCLKKEKVIIISATQTCQPVL